jgi:hypothetical protein
VTDDMIRIANCSGFFGDRAAAAREMVDGGPIDVLTGDYLAELTMAILMRQRTKDPDAGYVRTFLTQMEDVLATCLEKGVKVVANAGGLNPGGLVAALEDFAGRRGLAASVASVTGDDLMPTIEDHDLPHIDTGEPMLNAGLTPAIANAYVGGWGIAAALDRGADVVVTGRVTDAALVVGPAAWRFGWGRDDWDRLAGAVVAGHVIECGPQATGGNYAFFPEVPDLHHPGFPIAEVHADGSSVITKHPGTGGLVSVDTVTAQLLYEVGPPGYVNPDVVARLDTAVLEEAGHDRVRIAGVRGEPPPPTTKVAAVALDGFRNQVTFVLAGLDIEAKAQLAERALWDRLGGPEAFAASQVRLVRTDHADPPSNEAAFAYLQVEVADPDPDKVGRSFSSAAVELALANYPGLTLTSPPGRESPRIRYWPARAVQPASVVTLGDQVYRVEATPDAVSGTPAEVTLPDVSRAPIPAGPTVRSPLGRLLGARSGDKGGDANLGVWARTDAAFAWMEPFLTTDRLRRLLPEAVDLTIERYVFPNLRAVNFVLKGYLGEGVASSTKWDPQAKSLGEYFRAKVVDVPESLLAV